MTHSVPLLTYLLAVNSALGADLLVGPAQPYVTIEDAARAAASGDRILVDPGTYYEDQVALNADSLEILAVGGQGTVTVYLNPGENNFFELKNNSVLTLSDLVFDGQGEGRLADMRRSTLYVKRSLVSRTLSPNGGKG